MTGARVLLWAGVLVLAVPAAAGPESLSTLFPLRAEITSEEAGLCRLELPAVVIGACRPDLADLRIVGVDGREIPYLVDSPEPAGVAVGISYETVPEVVSAERSREALGDRVAVFRERFVLALPPPPSDVPAWEVELKVREAEFVCRLDAVAIGPGGERSVVVSRGSLYRLPSVGAERRRFTVPVRDAARLEVELTGEGPAYLEPRFLLRASRVLPGAAVSAVELDLLRVQQLAGVTEVLLDRPRGLVPRRLMVKTDTGTFHRRVTVWDEGPGADPEPLGAGAVLRVAALAPVEALEVPLRAPRGDRLRIVIENRDSPPLEGLGFAALMPRPVLVFSLPEGTVGAALLFGGGRARRPDYDLAALDPGARLPMAGESAQRAVAVLDPARARRAALGKVSDNPEFDPAPVLGFAMHPGALVDGRRFEHRRQLEVAPSPEGLSRLQLEPVDLALLRPDLADLRVVDRKGHQWAYLCQKGARLVESPIEIGDHKRKGRVSVVELDIPSGALSVSGLDLEAEAPYFDRDFVLRGRLEDGRERELASGRLVRRAGDPRPITLAVEPFRVTRLELHVNDGDDAPLVFMRARARSSAPDLFLAAPAGEYDLLLGDPEAEPPVYELERVRSTILAVPAADVTAGKLEANPAFRAASRLARSDAWQRILLWAVLGLAVVVLAVLTLRAART
jgi:hypothetical protein